MTIKTGALDLLVAGALCAVGLTAGVSGAETLTLAIGLHGFFVVAALLVNTVGLAPYLRQAAWRVVLMPDSSLALNVPLALMSPGIQHLQRQCGSTSRDGHGLR